MPKVARDTCRVGGFRDLVVKGRVYEDDDPVVKDYPDLFDEPSEFQKRTAPPKDTDELGERSMSARPSKVERATQEPGEKRDVDLTCDVCGFDAASPAGLGAHKRSHD